MDLGGALESAVAARLAPRIAIADRVRAALDSLLAAERAAVTSRVTAEVLRTLGAEADKADEAASEATTAALDELRAAVAAILPPPIPKFRAATAEEIARSKSLRAELSDVGRTASAMPPGRLVLVLRALAVEARALMSPPLSPSDPVYESLSDALDTMLRVRRASKLSEFIFGLQLSQDDDWASLAQTARERLERFDREAGKKFPLKIVGGNRKR